MHTDMSQVDHQNITRSFFLPRFFIYVSYLRYYFLFREEVGYHLNVIQVLELSNWNSRYTEHDFVKLPNT